MTFQLHIEIGGRASGPPGDWNGFAHWESGNVESRTRVAGNAFEAVRFTQYDRFPPDPESKVTESVSFDGIGTEMVTL